MLERGRIGNGKKFHHTKEGYQQGQSPASQRASLVGFL